MERQHYDVAIVGGGIIGLSTAMHLTQRNPDLRVAVLEKEAELATHQTGHNSGVIHSGIYYRPGSHKANFCVAGVQKLIQFCDENEIEYERCGKVIVATDESELGRLDSLYERGVANGVEGLEIIGPERLREIEPHAAGIKALWAPGTGIADYPKVAQTYATKFAHSGGDIFTEAPLQRITRRGDSLALETAKGTVQANHMINCAGLYADRVASMIEERVDVRIVPFRGEYYTLKPESHHLVSGTDIPGARPAFSLPGRSLHAQHLGQRGGGPQRGAGSEQRRLPQAGYEPRRDDGYAHLSGVLENDVEALAHWAERNAPLVQQKCLPAGPPASAPRDTRGRPGSRRLGRTSPGR